MTACGTLTQDKNKEWRDPRIAHFPKKPEITNARELVIRKPNLQKLKIFTPNIVKAKDSNKEKANRMKQIAKNITDGVPHIKEDINFKKVADLVEDEKPYDKMSMIMLWLAVLSSCTLAWCIVWFVGRNLLK